ncbi:hypothetical protein B0T16DRAFT_221322 [Cercophora newfieldiana]|uniref:Uncharacterized protein n=1 Tax=Cercophora newfieldiana TaxID=92897 RepID=A0AA39XXE4_9PEZI|nr:hypothetical protein B0T16DRAFT_221322 [Cercophora newfieldiana]
MKALQELPVEVREGFANPTLYEPTGLRPIFQKRRIRRHVTSLLSFLFLVQLVVLAANKRLNKAHPAWRGSHRALRRALRALIVLAEARTTHPHSHRRHDIDRNENAKLKRVYLVQLQAFVTGPLVAARRQGRQVDRATRATEIVWWLAPGLSELSIACDLPTPSSRHPKQHSGGAAVGRSCRALCVVRAGQHRIPWLTAEACARLGLRHQNPATHVRPSQPLCHSTPQLDKLDRFAVG